MYNHPRILICPLDWGLGHASRDIYLIKRLLERKFEIIIGGEGDSLALLRSEFPDLKFINLPSFKIRLSRNFPVWFMVILLGPGIIRSIVHENIWLKQAIREYSIDIVISDAHYGLWNHKILSVIITHQVNFKLPLLFRPLQFLVNLINRIAIKKFTWCWIPDFPGYPNLSGDLSHRLKIPGNTQFIGPLSRFYHYEKKPVPCNDYEIAVLISGPESQRSVFEQIITEQLIRSKRKSIIICGKIKEDLTESLTNTCIKISFLPGKELATVLKASKYIFCRSGYSTIMDLVALKRTAFLIPTPGQTEQEYLARNLDKQKLFLYSEQRNFNLEDAISRLDRFIPAMEFNDSFDLPDRAIERLWFLKERGHQL